MTTPGTSSANAKSPFEEFLRAEYQNLAQAHFNTINTISEFFKQYILILSLPISIAVVFLKPTELKTSGVLDYLRNHPSIPLSLFLLVVVVGLWVMGYVVNLRFDAILYARAVNGIRKLFYESSGLSIEEELRVRVLPRQIHLPPYIESRYFGFVVLTFAFLDSAYFFLGLYFYMWAMNWPRYSGRLLWLGLGSCFAIHILLYIWLGRYREWGYLRGGHILGIDIDGVLNEHRSHFCGLLASQTGKELHDDQITRIPVHEIPGCSVTREDEHAVFNWPRYWSEMPATQGAAKVIASLRNQFGYQIWVFTHRPWPQPTTFPQESQQRYWEEWQKHSQWVRFAKWNIVQRIEKFAADWLHLQAPVSGRILRDMTVMWLKSNKFTFDKLVIEKGNTDTRDPLGHTRNRFVICQKKSIRFFVEDDVNKALKLADICQIVFLRDQPYNRDAQLPNNVVRVTSWQEIESSLRRIS